MANEPTIGYAPVRIELQELPVALANRIYREARPRLAAIHGGLPAMLATTAQVAAETLSAVERLWWNAEGGQRIRLEITTAIPPLTRTILDSLFTVVFVFDEPIVNARWYHASGWRDMLEHHHRIEQKHGGDPAWRKWLDESAQWVERLKLDVLPEEIARPRLIEWWPNPGKMTRTRRDGQPYLRDTARRSLLEHLNDWHYGELSGDAHLSYLGMLRRGGVLASSNQAHVLEKYASTSFLNAVTLFLALMSEIAAEVRLPFESARAARVWDHLADWEAARDLYALRYRRLLEVASAG